MKASVSALAATLLAGTSVCALADGFLYTPTAGKICADRSRTSLGAWSCPGPAGHAAEFFDEGNVASFGIRLPPERTARTRYAWRGAEKVFGDLVEWQVDKGRPRSAVLRIWRTASDSTGRERTVSELLVFRISAATPCKIAAIDTRRPGANEIAHVIMSQGNRPCETEIEPK